MARRRTGARKWERVDSPKMAGELPTLLFAANFCGGEPWACRNVWNVCERESGGVILSGAYRARWFSPNANQVSHKVPKSLDYLIKTT